jgi:hypothetical protein
MAERLEDILKPGNLTMMCIATLLFPVFFLWMHRQEQRGNKPLIPNSLWKNMPFLTINVIVLLQWGVLQSMDVYYSLL